MYDLKSEKSSPLAPMYTAQTMEPSRDFLPDNGGHCTSSPPPRAWLH